MTRYSQKVKELDIANFFLNRLNKYYGFSYQPQINENENDVDRYVDIFGTEAKGNNILKLQLATYDGDLHQGFANARKKRGKLGLPYAFGPICGGHVSTPIESILEKKKNKTTGEEILIVYNDYDTFLWDENGAKEILPKLVKNTKFNGVFLIVMPSPQTGGYTNFPHDGQVIAIKNTFNKNENGISF